MVLIVIASVSLLLAADDLTPVPEIDPALLERIKVEARPIVARYRAQGAHSHESSVMKVHQAGKPPRTVHVTQTRNGKLVLFEATTVIGNDVAGASTEIKGRNEDYHFSIARQAANAPFILMGYAANQPSDPIAGSDLQAYAYHDVHFLLKAIDGEDGFTLKALHQDKDGALVRARYLRRLPGEKPMVSDVEFLMDSENQWRVVESIVRNSTNTCTTRMTYGQTLHGLAYPVELTTSTLTPGAAAKPPSSVQVSLKVEPTSKRASDFRLSAFGLPEPVEYQRPGPTLNSTWLLLIGCGVCFLAAVALRYLARHSQAAFET